MSKEKKQKKTIYKRWWFIGIAIILVIGAIGGGSKDEAEEPEKEIVEKKEEVEEVEEVSEEDQAYWDSVKENIIGVSDKDFNEVTSPKPGSVRGDTTDKWKKVVISDGIDAEEYAKSYHDMYMEDKEVHFIVDFGRNTTTSIREAGGLIYVDISDYEDKEEHDAKKIGSGLLLKQYKIYPDGDIEEIE